MVAAVVGDDAVDHRASGGVVAHVEVQGVAPDDALDTALRAGLLGAEVAEAHVADVLRGRDVEQHHVRAAVGRALDLHVAREVQHLGVVGDPGTDRDRGVGELGRTVERHGRAVDGGDGATVVMLGVALDRRGVGGRDHDLVADPPPLGVGDGDGRVALRDRGGEVGPGALAGPLQIEHPGADDPQPDVGVEGLHRVAADHAVFVDALEDDPVGHIRCLGARTQGAAHDHVAGAGERARARHVEDQFAAGLDPHPGDRGVDVEDHGLVDHCDVLGPGDRAAPGRGVAPAGRSGGRGGRGLVGGRRGAGCRGATVGRRAAAGGLLVVDQEVGEEARADQPAGARHRQDLASAEPWRPARCGLGGLGYGVWFVWFV